MNNVTIEIGDYDLELINQIFDNEKDFQPRDPRDKVLIEVMRQVRDNPKVKITDAETN